MLNLYCSQVGHRDRRARPKYYVNTTVFGSRMSNPLRLHTHSKETIQHKLLKLLGVETVKETT